MKKTFPEESTLPPVVRLTVALKILKESLLPASGNCEVTFVNRAYSKKKFFMISLFR